MYIKFWGVRGSVPVPGKDTIRYGGNTTCIEIRTNEGQLIIVDAGTGIRLLGIELLKGDFGKGKGVAHILFTHSHWDHIQGFPFFPPAYVGSRDASGKHAEQSCNILNLYGASDVDDRLEAALRGQMEHFYFPIDLNTLSACLTFNQIQNKPIEIGSAQVIARRLTHPNGVLGYRIQDGNQSVVIATDCEHPADGSVDQNLAELAKGADLLIYDSQYTPEEYDPAAYGLQIPGKVGWGHSTMIHGAQTAKALGVKRLLLTHHDPLHNDAMVDEIEKRAKEVFPASQAAYEGLVIQF